MLLYLRIADEESAVGHHFDDLVIDVVRRPIVEPIHPLNPQSGIEAVVRRDFPANLFNNQIVVLRGRLVKRH